MVQATSSETERLSSTIVLCETGDLLRLIIGSKKVNVVVSRTVLSLLSPAFKVMVTGPFREGSPETSLIPLPGDDPAPLLLLLKIGHLKFKELPTSLSFTEIFNLAIVCDKYDTIGPVRPFFEKYIAGYWSYLGAVNSDKWLFITWTFGVHDAFEKALDALVWNCRLSRSGDQIVYNDQDVTSILQYLGLDVVVLESRRQTIESTINQINKEFDMLIKCSDRCSIYKLGYMTKKLYISIGFVPKSPEAVELFNELSLCNLSSRILNIIPSCIERGHPEHEKQQAYFRAYVKGINPPICLPENIIRHLEIQAAK